MLAIVLIGCGPPGVSGFGEVDSGAVFDTGVGTFSTNSDGTQIGSEGIFGCPVDTRTPIEADASVDGFSASPVALITPLLGEYTGEVEDAQQTLGPATLNLGNVTGYELVDVIGPAPCADYIHVKLDGSLVVGELASGQFPGAIGMRPDEARLILAASLSQITGSALPLTFDPAEMDTTELNIGGTVTPTALDGSIFFVGCRDGTCTTDAPQGTFSFTR
jgi:hypothetical protein